ncbi:hypothetical protein [Morganella psychrotolerans]|uniref:Uncharacterized protein n=1 Tax=Morganella psychrotolerans TaxID=368603 RepID=A0A1B8HNJ5_9GAMM|nr:hypothetical protein [Morganella psychrotolerans]OBU10781.1 hypothetical protein AYY17_14780 [Morganella psychrotolerans]
MGTDVFDQELLSFHARKILRFYRDVMYCHIASPARYSDPDDIKISAAEKCHKVIVDHEKNLNLKESYEYLSVFFVKSRMIKAFDSLGITCDFNIIFYNYFILMRNHSFILSSRPDGREVTKMENARLLCYLVLCICDYLDDVDVSEYISKEITCLLEYKEKLDYILSLHSDWFMHEFNDIKHHEVITDNNSFNPLIIERKIERLKNEMLTKRNDKTKKERELLSEIVKLLLKNGYDKHLNKAMNIISSSPLLKDYIDPRTVSRIMAKGKENKIKSDGIDKFYSLKINAKEDEVTKVKRGQYGGLAHRKYGGMDPLSCRKNFLILKFRDEIDNIK